MKKLMIALLVGMAGIAHADSSVSIGIAIPGVYLGYSTPQYAPPQYYAPRAPIYVAPPVYVNPHPGYYGNGHGYGHPRYRNHGRQYQPTCTTYYTQRGPRTECF